LTRKHNHAKKDGVNTLNHKENLIILGRIALKYIDEIVVEYIIDGEMVVSDNYDYVIFSDTIQFYEDYIKEKQPDNIIDRKNYDKNRYSSNISEVKAQEIINRIKELSKKKER
jgi:hypothetical protein